MADEVRPLKFQTQERSAFSKVLPLLVFLSFVWLNLYSNSQARATTLLSIGNGWLFWGIVTSLVNYLIFELLFAVYRFLIGFSVYSFMIPRRVLVDRFRIWFVIRNLLLGVFYNLRFFAPYISVYLCVLELIFNFMFIIGMYFSLAKNYVEPLVGQFVFKSLTIPMFIYEAIRVIILVVNL